MLICCFIVGLGVFALRNLAGPDLARTRRDDWREIKGTGQALGQSLSVQGRSGENGEAAVALSVEAYYPAELRGSGFAAAVIAPGVPFVDIRAPEATWDEEAGCWRFGQGGQKWSYASSSSTSPGK